MTELENDTERVVHESGSVLERVRDQPRFCGWLCAASAPAFVDGGVVAAQFDSDWGRLASVFTPVALLELFSPAKLLSGATREIRLSDPSIRCVGRYRGDAVPWLELTQVKVERNRAGCLTVVGRSGNKEQFRATIVGKPAKRWLVADAIFETVRRQGVAVAK